jgi:hypothetical protein
VAPPRFPAVLFGKCAPGRGCSARGACARVLRCAAQRRHRRRRLRPRGAAKRAAGGGGGGGGGSGARQEIHHGGGGDGSGGGGGGRSGGGGGSGARPNRQQRSAIASAIAIPERRSRTSRARAGLVSGDARSFSFGRGAAAASAAAAWRRAAQRRTARARATWRAGCRHCALPLALRQLRVRPQQRRPCECAAEEAS